MRPSALVALGVLLLAALAAAALLTTRLSGRARGPVVSGRVVDAADGRPLPAAEIRFTRLGGKGRSGLLRLAADASGGFSAAQGRAERIRLEAWAPGHAPAGLEAPADAAGWRGELRLVPLGPCGVLPSGQGRLAFGVLGVGEGWDLEGGRAAPPEACDLLPAPDPAAAGRVGGLLAANGAGLSALPLPPGAMPRWSFASAVEAPEAGYVPSVRLEGASVFFVRTRHGRHARILVLPPAGPAGGALAFEWVIQPDGSRRLATPSTGWPGEGKP